VTAYTATVPFSSSTVTVTPTAAQSDSTITVDGVTTISGSASAAIALTVGSNAITVVVTAPDPAYLTTYTVTVTRETAPTPPPAPAPDPGPSGGGGSESGGTGDNPGPVPDPGLDLGLIVPAVTTTIGAGSLYVLQNGQPVDNVIVIPNRQSTGMDVIGREFGVQVVTLTPTRRPVGLESARSEPRLVAEAGGWIDVRADGYAPDTTLRAYLARRGAPRTLIGATSRMLAPVDWVLLGDAIVPSGGDVSTAFPIPAGLNVGDYVLQVNGVTPDRQVRSVNLPLQLVKPAPTRTILRRGCVFAPGSARLTVSCERYLRVVSQKIPTAATGKRIVIIGASTGEPTRAANRALARKRARTVAFYLRALGVQGQLVRTTVTTTGRPRGPIAKQAVIVRNGIPRTTVLISYLR